jgi:PQQ-like domain
MQFRKMTWAAAAAAVVLSGLPAGVAQASARSAQSGQGAAAPASSRAGQPAPVSVTGWAHGQPVRTTPAGGPATGPAGAAPTAPVAPGADPNGGSLALRVSDAIESAQGTPLTAALPGSHGGYLRVHEAGPIAAMSASGQVRWQVTSADLYAAWHLSWNHLGSTTPTPEVVGGNPPDNPFVVAGVQAGIVANARPYAVGQLGGTQVVAVAQAVGVSLIGARCFNCAQPFTVPGSSLSMGTFVTVLSARTGAVLYSELDPGFVTQVAITRGLLLIGDETGSPDSRQPMGQWYSTSSVRALAFRPAGGRLQAAQRWKYSTGAPWARLFALTAAGSDEVTLAWSDTPPGLGVPGPPDGHVVALSAADGRVRWDRRTAGYPVLASYDPARRLLAVVSQQDVAAGISYTLTGLRPATGSTALALTRAGDLATALTVTAGRPGEPDRWLVGAVDTRASADAQSGLEMTAGRVTAVDPARQRQLWSARVAAAGLSPLMPGAVVSTGGAVVVGSWDTELEEVSTTHPFLTDTAVAGLSLDSGRRLWQRSGDTADPLSLSVAGESVRLATQKQSAQLIDPVTGRVRASQPLLGNVTAAVTADAGGAGATPHGTSDLILGDQSGGVFALSGQSLASGQPRPLWQVQVGGPVVQMVVADLDGSGHPDLVVAATSAVAVIDLRTGRLRYQVAFPGQYIWSVAAGRLGTSSGSPMGIVVPGSSLTALDGRTGHRLWTWQPKSHSYFANAQITHGMVVTDYAGLPAGSGSAAAMAEVGISGATGRVAWTAPQPATTTSGSQPRNGVIASPDIPGAGGLGAAFSWTTSDGDGRVDVRNAVTGALDYTNDAPELAAHQGFLTDPQLGLIDYGQDGTTVIKPSGPQAHDSVDAYSAAVTTAPSGQRMLDVAYNSLQAYPVSLLSTPGAEGQPLATDPAYLPGQVVAARLAGLGSVVVTIPQNQTVLEVIAAEQGQIFDPLVLDSQLGATVVSMTGTPAGGAAPARARRAVPAQPRPRTVSLAAAPPDSGLTQPDTQLAVHGYDRAGRPELTSAQPAGFSPAAIRGYLGATSSGAGQTVAIVDAYADPSIRHDVNAFSAQYGLPPACPGDRAGAGCFRLTLHRPPAGTAADSDWDLETSLDVEWVHAIVPRARIVLVESASAGLSDQFPAVAAAARYRPDAISLSWDLPQEFSDEGYYDHYCAVTASVCVVASGDDGYPSGYPATSSRVLTVGGTTLQLTPDHAVSSEVAWAGSGGGRSYFEPASPAQRAVTGDRLRNTPDVSYDADPATGVAVYDSTPYEGQAGWFQVGGTSLGAPSWAAILAGADQLLRQAGHPVLTQARFRAQQAVYRLPAAALADITGGPANGSCPGLCQPGTGFDDVTGLGSPRTGVEAALAAAGR